MWSPLTFLCLLSLVQCSVYVGFPFDQQLPNVARVNEDYSFTMANTTYKSTSGTVSYSVSGLPSWLNFDSGSRTFTGHPTSDDVNNYTFTLTGSDSSNSISHDYTILVSKDPGLHLSSERIMFNEIAKHGNTNGRNGLVVSPGDKFDIQFSKSVFESYKNSSRPIVAYYGRSADRSSLPNWMNFDSDSLTFSGTVPYVTSKIAPSFAYSFSFIASDYYGYAGAEGIFDLIVGAHELSTSVNRTFVINGTLGGEIDVEVPITSDVFLDGEEITKHNISSVYAEDLPDYADFNEDNYTITGTFPNSPKRDNFTIIVEDMFENTVELSYELVSIGSIFTVKSLPDVNATEGEYFSHQLLRSYFTDFNKTKISTSFDDADWLSFDEKNLTLHGNAPKNLKKLNINVDASADGKTQTKAFSIRGIPRKKKSSSSSSSSSSAQSTKSGTSSKHSSSSSPKHHSGLSNKAKLGIGLGVGIPGFLILVAALLLIFCCCRKNSAQDEEKKEMGGDKSELDSVPGMGVSHGAASTIAPVSTDRDDEDAKRLSKLNVLKLDERNSSDSNMSSETNVESDGDSVSSGYYDASEKPVISWRAKDSSDAKNFRVSDLSMSTVNTDQLFSVRLVDDQVARNSSRSSRTSALPVNGGYGTIVRDSSGNLQRLDSDGNIVETTSSSPNRVSHSTSSNLDVLHEELGDENANSQMEDLTEEQPTESTIKHDNSTIYHSMHNLSNNVSDSSQSNLLSNFNNTSNSNSEKELYGYEQRSSGSSSYDDNFHATTNADGEVQWTKAHSSQFIGASSSDQLISTNSPPDLRHSNLSAISFDSINSDKLPVNKDLRSSSATSFSKKAKLIDFTRKGSLRESANKPDLNLEGETAQIDVDD